MLRQVLRDRMSSHRGLFWNALYIAADRKVNAIYSGLVLFSPVFNTLLLDSFLVFDTELMRQSSQLCQFCLTTGGRVQEEGSR